MKVTLNSFFNLQPTNKNKEKNSKSLPQNVTSPRNKNCDEIIISAKIEKADQNPFIDNLKGKLTSEVNTTCSEQKIASLKQQIEEGSYKIDVDQIAKKMLLH